MAPQSTGRSIGEIWHGWATVGGGRRGGGQILTDKLLGLSLEHVEGRGGHGGGGRGREIGTWMVYGSRRESRSRTGTWGRRLSYATRSSMTSHMSNRRRRPALSTSSDSLLIIIFAKDFVLPQVESISHAKSTGMKAVAHNSMRRVILSREKKITWRLTLYLLDHSPIIAMMARETFQMIDIVLCSHDHFKGGYILMAGGTKTSRTKHPV